MAAPPPLERKPSKTMSSRLLTMKFMQRGATASVVASNNLETSPRSSKRQRLSASSTPTTPAPEIDAINAAIRKEEETRKAALAKTMMEKGEVPRETEWVLGFQEHEDRSEQRVIKEIRSSGKWTGQVDDDDEETVRIGMGRRSFGGWKRKNEVQNQEGHEDSDKEEGADSEDNSDSDSSSVSDTPRRRKSSFNQRHSQQQKPPPVSLKGLTSISGGGGSSSFSGTCHLCGQQGHMKSDCPSRGKNRKARRSGDFGEGLGGGKKGKQGKKRKH
ncbi:MAG: hypothetical protein M1834_005022 [Cirrosporium novae-zelandiae]|nr:MAG: hypothetical protein M1834_005022 [Cirrosporium novae-zelandiae]